MNRTKPSGIRFDPDKLEFVKGREKLKSNQQVVDLLMNRYWWEFKLPIPNHKEAPPLDLKNGIPSPFGGVIEPEPIKEAPTQRWLTKSDKEALKRQYVDERKEFTCDDEHRDWHKRVDNDERLNKDDKIQVKNTR